LAFVEGCNSMIRLKCFSLAQASRKKLFWRDLRVKIPSHTSIPEKLRVFWSDYFPTFLSLSFVGSFLEPPLWYSSGCLNFVSKCLHVGECRVSRRGGMGEIRMLSAAIECTSNLISVKVRCHIQGWGIALEWKMVNPWRLIELFHNCHTTQIRRWRQLQGSNLQAKVLWPMLFSLKNHLWSTMIGLFREKEIRSIILVFYGMNVSDNILKRSRLFSVYDFRARAFRKRVNWKA